MCVVPPPTTVDFIEVFFTVAGSCVSCWLHILIHVHFVACPIHNNKRNGGTHLVLHIWSSTRCSYLVLCMRCWYLACVCAVWIMCARIHGGDRGLVLCGVYITHCIQPTPTTTIPKKLLTSNNAVWLQYPYLYSVAFYIHSTDGVSFMMRCTMMLF